MYKKFFTSFLWALLGWIAAISILSGFAIYDAPIEAILTILILLVFFASLYATKLVIEAINKDKLAEISKLNTKVANAETEKKSAQADEQLWKQTLLERTSGFPSLIKRIQEYETIKDNQLSGYLKNKSHPAYKAAELVKIEANRRREAEYIRKRTEAIIEYYEYLAPFLLDVKDDISIDLDQEEIFNDYSESEQEDPVTKYLTKEEYRKLPSFERNQLALDRFWKRPNKSKWLLGKMYERFIGYLYEKDGYDVEYHGIQRKLEDLGIDLICRKGDETLLIQCKNWSQFRTIYEKHIFQLFGTSFQFSDANPKEKVRAVFITTTQLSDIARKFAEKLGIELKENFRFDQGYPSIKCNINATSGEKIYHLPFDQQYDKTKISLPGEMYLLTTRDAEDAGFRRAFRWHATSK